MSDIPEPATAEQNTAPVTDGAATSEPAKETDNATSAELRILRKQLKEREQKLSAFQAAADEKAKAEMTESERYKAEAEQARAELEATRAESATEKKANAFKLAAIAAGAGKPELLLRLADLSTLELDGGTVSGVEALIKSLQKDVPELFSSSTPSTSNGGGNSAKGAPSVTSKDIANMTKEQYREYKADFLSKHQR